jgi:hypothetical protein
MPTTARELPGQPVEKQHAIREPRQGVGQGELPEVVILSGGLTWAFGAIADVRDLAKHCLEALGFAQRRVGQAARRLLQDLE